jgi:hypothetical protein
MKLEHKIDGFCPPGVFFGPPGTAASVGGSVLLLIVLIVLASPSMNRPLALGEDALGGAHTSLLFHS